ncbi:hypothetical protein [Saccharopolyspora taberi]|uniref:Uncharacterized protein n=1 Tax=Saccharopolyspora taberi TaxID=60895 RepID=A0ABN3VBK6_9PSEU
MTQQKQTPREHSSEPAEGPLNQADMPNKAGTKQPTTGEQLPEPRAEGELRRHTDQATEGE